MDTSTGRIYHGVREDKKHVSLDEKTATLLEELPEDQRNNYYINTEFDQWYKTVEGHSGTSRRDLMRRAFRAAWEIRESKI